MDGKWINHYFNFDDVKSSMLTLFVISTFDDWGIILNIAANSNISSKVINFFGFVS